MLKMVAVGLSCLGGSLCSSQLGLGGQIGRQIAGPHFQAFLFRL